MLFNSLEFLFFFPIVFIFYFSIPFKYRWLLLLVASYFFYMSWKAEYIILIIISTLIDYTCGILIDKTEKKNLKNIYLALSLISNFSMLFYFKYLNFFWDSASFFLNQTHSPLVEILLPMGISFYTFQTVSYTIDVYRGNIKAEKHLGIFALYVTFFPQLVAGPIERSENLIPQFKINHKFSYQNVKSGLLQVMFGFFKKVVIADRLVLVVDSIYQNPSNDGAELIWATYFFAFQIYCDFSAYSDIAIGISRMMGFELMKNFETPYFSTSIGEFWRRWHISLSTWFRDYLYIPLGGNKVSRNRFYFNIFIVFLVSGLWHGASYNFLIWGTIHGLLLVIENRFKQTITKITTPIPLFIRKIWIFHLVCFGWIFFRARTITDSLTIVKKIFTSNPIELALNGARCLKLPDYSSNALLICLLLTLEYIAKEKPIHEYVLSKNRFYRYAFAYILLFIILVFGKFNTTNSFIYFQF